MKQFLSSSGIKSLNGSHAADFKTKVVNTQNKKWYIGGFSFINPESKMILIEKIEHIALTICHLNSTITAETDIA